MRRTDIELLGEDWSGRLSDLSEVPLNESAGIREDDLVIYVWRQVAATSRVGPLLEMRGNRTVKLTGRYSFRYDPPRTASTGANAAPRGDFHLFHGDEEIAAWDDQGVARHGYKRGHRLPQKAYRAIVSQYPGVHGLKGRLLELCQQAASEKRGSVLVDLNEELPRSDDAAS